MKLEKIISDMMTINNLGRLWHWTTENAQHHVTYETFLTQNEGFTDSVVESALGNDIKIDFSKVGVTEAVITTYDLDKTREAIKDYRNRIFKFKQELEKIETSAATEIISLLDDATEACSKTLYLLKLK